MRTILALGLGLAVAGCGGGGGNPTPMPDMTMLPDLAPAGPASPTEFDIGLSVAYCTFNVRCGFIGASEKTACEAAAPGNRTMYPPAYDLEDAVKTGRVKYDPVAAQACIDAWKNAGCSADQQFAVDPICNKVYVPEVPVGSACFANQECVSGYCKDSQARGCMGTCTAFLALNDTCDPNNDTCDPTTSYCDSTNAPTCLALAKAGESCDVAFCDATSFCIADPLPMDGGMGDAMPTQTYTCRAVGKMGDVCQVFFFGNDTCDPSLYCDDTQDPPRCAMQHDMGGTCGSYAACKDGLDCIGLDYDQNTGMTITGKCGPYLDIGGTCDPMLFESGCPYDESCDMGSKKCALRGIPGADCSADQYCTNNYYCDVNSVCSKTVPFGSACTPPADPNTDPDPCQQGSCDMTAKKCVLVCM